MKNKLCVETLGYSWKQKVDKILTVMRSYPEGITPKEISRLSSINVNTVKSILPKLENVKKIMRGYYKVYNWGDAPQPANSSELTKWNFHNAIFSTTLKHFPSKLIETTHSLDLVNLKFIINNSGKATLRLASDYPLNVSSICIMAGYFQEQINKYSNSRPTFSDIKVQTIEFNRDYNNLRLDGVKCITIDNLTEQFKIYQKKLGLRIEHKTKIKFTVENVVDMLSTNPNSLELNIKLSKQKEQLDRLMTATSNNTKQLWAVIDALKLKTGE